jgi:osmotically-inducible protein OsmY
VIVGSFILDPNSIDVQVHEGVVTLSGRVARRIVAASLVDDVRAVSGVVDVIDQVTYQTEDTQPAAIPAVLY